MLFNSIDFAIFLPVLFILYWFVFNKNLRLQNLLIVGASYLFYGWWDWRFLSLIFFSTICDFYIGLRLKDEQELKKRKFFLWTSILVNLGFLGFFKYYNFFADNFVTAFTFLGGNISPSTLNIVLPVGISFYTFQTLSYSIDVYRKKLAPTEDFVVFASFVSFFPQLVAGPIERATHLLPQFTKPRVFDHPKAVDGMRQILWGLFKKMVIADNCAEVANYIFNNSDSLDGSVLILGTIFFGFQIYGDFSGYSDIAIGTAKLFGFDLMQNFAFPFFSRDMAEFWRRWHISLSSWFKDYLYIPLGGSRGGTSMRVRNTFIIFIVSGFWHGANWTFVLWGALNAFYVLPVLLSKNNKKNLDIVARGKYLPSLREFIGIFITYCMTLTAWILFRAENLHHAYAYTMGILSWSTFTLPIFPKTDKAILTLLLISVFIVIEWLGRTDKFAIEKIGLQWPLLARWTFYAFIVFAIGMFMQTEETPFIYFQF